jgi:hypothetical protein
VFSSDPTDGAPGVDVAVIELKSQPEQATSYHEAALANASEVPELADVLVSGSLSGTRRGWVLGAMLSMRTIKGRIWKNCWTIVEYDGGLVQQGDSGGPAKMHGSKEVLGHVVAAIGVERSKGRRQMGLVQDIHTIVGHLKSDYEYSVDVLLEGRP